MVTRLRLPLSDDAIASGTAAPPLIDQRQRLSWPQRLPGRLGTSALWLGSCSLLGPAKLAALLLVGGLMAPTLLWLDRQRGLEVQRASCQAATSLAGSLDVRESDLRAASGSPRQAPGHAAPGGAGLGRAALAAQLGLAEAQLFRARHAVLCTVHHDEQGRIVALELPTPPLPLPLPSLDAHPVG